MMKKILPILIILVILFSCQKEITENRQSDPVPLHADTPVLLTRLLVLDTTVVSPSDTLATYAVSYDSIFRPATLLFNYYMGGVPVYTSTLRYEYQGADTMAVRTTNLIQDGASLLHDTMYYTYDAGKLVADSLRARDAQYYEAHHYTYYPDRIAATYSFAGSGSGNTRDGWDAFYQTFSNGNLLHQHDTLMYNYISSGSPAEQWMVDDITISYLPNPDPFYNVIKPVRRPYYLESDWIWESTPFFTSPNLPEVNQHNIEQWNTAGTGSSSYSENTSTYTYEFRTDGYPSIMRQLEVEMGGTYNRYFKLMYYYNK